jgi:hypothetical protein
MEDRAIERAILRWRIADARHKLKFTQKGGTSYYVLWRQIFQARGALKAMDRSTQPAG